MSFDLFTDEHEDLRQALSVFIANELKPYAEEWEEAEGFPVEVFRKMGNLGYLGMSFPEEYGGLDDHVAETVLHEEMVRCDSGGVAASVGGHVSIALPPIAKFGTHEQKQKYLAGGIEGTMIGALGITEPNTGSDVSAIQTYAVRDGSDWIINGSKTFITNGAKCDFLVLAAKTDRDKGYGGISHFIVDKGTPGFEVVRKLKKAGWKSSDTAELSFIDCRVPSDALLGELNRGFYQIMANFMWERLTLSIGAVASSQIRLEETIAYAKEREVFGKPVSSFQAIAHKLADLSTEIEAARQITYNALKLYFEGRDALKEVAMTKLFTAKMACHVADECLQIYGGYGYMDEYPISRHWRDVRVLPIGGGTNEIMREIIGKFIGI